MERSKSKIKLKDRINCMYNSTTTTTTMTTTCKQHLYFNLVAPA